MTEQKKGGGGLVNQLPFDRLKEAGQELLAALSQRAVDTVSGKIGGMTGRLTDFAENGGPGLMAAVTGSEALASGKSPIKAAMSAGVAGVKEKASEVMSGKQGGGGSSTPAKVTNIIEQADVGLPIRVVYDQWTQFEEFPSFTRKVEKVEQESDEKVTWRAQIFLSHREWEATIMEQVPDERIVWHSKGSRGYPDGTVTFHELTPDLTRILLVIEYHPQGFFEKTANLWRAQGRRVRSDFKHIKRHLMTRTILEQDEIEGWRGEIRDGEVVKSHEDAMNEEQDRAAEAGQHERPEEEEAEYAQEGEEYGPEEEEGYEEGAEEEYAETEEPEFAEEQPGRERVRAGRDK
jgi:uncharacterized membrane protein